jgi:hypothetical protein
MFASAKMVALSEFELDEWRGLYHAQKGSPAGMKNAVVVQST